VDPLASTPGNDVPRIVTPLRQMVEDKLHTFLFADIAGYSLVADQRGDEAAADLALHFLSRASSIAGAHGGEVVKSLGDGVMVHAEDAAESVRLALELMSDFGRGAAHPPLHAGLHTGPALRRADDWWGTTVNVAARLAAAARPGQLLVTEATRLEAAEVASTQWRGLEPLWLKNVRLPVQVYAASRIPPHRAGRDLILPLDSPLPAIQTVTA
jgi:adenylate cyclase